MPLPLFIVGAIKVAGVAAATYGAGRGVHSVVQNKEAKEVQSSAESKYERAKKSTKKAIEESNKSIENLGQKKLEILTKSVDDYVKTFEQLKKVNLKESEGLREIGVTEIDGSLIAEARELSSTAISVLKGIAGGAGAGALAAFGATSATMALGTAGTGAAISSLVGIAQTNATLAFLGGGTLAAGGGGIAAGATVLGTLAAAPALFLLGTIMDKSASANLDKAYTYNSEVNKAVAEMDTVRTLCNGVTARSNMFIELLDKLNEMFIQETLDLKYLIKYKGNDYSQYTYDEQVSVGRGLALLKSIKSVLDTPILDKDGNLTKQSGDLLSEFNGDTQADDKRAILVADDIYGSSVYGKISEGKFSRGDRVAIYRNGTKILTTTIRTLYMDAKPYETVGYGDRVKMYLNNITGSALQKGDIVEKV